MDIKEKKKTGEIIRNVPEFKRSITKCTCNQEFDDKTVEKVKEKFLEDIKDKKGGKALMIWEEYNNNFHENICMNEILEFKNLIPEYCIEIPQEEDYKTVLQTYGIDGTTEKIDDNVINYVNEHEQLERDIDNVYIHSDKFTCYYSDDVLTMIENCAKSFVSFVEEIEKQVKEYNNTHVKTELSFTYEYKNFTLYFWHNREKV